LIDCLNHGIYGVKRNYGFNKNHREGDLIDLKAKKLKQEQRSGKRTSTKPLFFNRRLEKTKDRALKVEKEQKKLYLRRGKSLKVDCDGFLTV
jgi:hypothetical protein